MEKTLRFSEPFVNAEHVAYEADFRIDRKSIVINIDLDDIEIEEVDLPSFGSIMCSNVTIEKAKNILVISVANDDFLGENVDIDREIIQNSWQHIHTLTNIEALKKTNLWRSEKSRLGRIELNLWYAPSGTHCGIHNTHPFQEVHTQIYGIGRMQKFRSNNFKSLFQEVYMSPGYTHEPFYDNQGNYPWHQYYADTDCIWLAIEQHQD